MTVRRICAHVALLIGTASMLLVPAGCGQSNSQGRAKTTSISKVPIKPGRAINQDTTYAQIPIRVEDK